MRPICTCGRGMYAYPGNHAADCPRRVNPRDPAVTVKLQGTLEAPDGTYRNVHVTMTLDADGNAKYRVEE